MNANIKAVGAYLQRLRELQGLTRTKVAAAFDTVEAQISAIEKGKRETRTSMTVNLVSFLGGSLDDVASLMLSEQATPDYATQLAERWHNQNQHQARRVAEDAPGYHVNGSAK
jgi:transcriptional regulator with XRE-family HTH domain